MEKVSYTLIDPKDGKLLFKLFQFDDNSHFDHLQRNNYYTLIYISEGQGKVKADFNEYLYPEKSLFFFSPYQPYIIYPEHTLKGVAIHFHSDFFCIYRYPAEVASYNYLFNSIYEAPFIQLHSENEEHFLIHKNFILDELRNDNVNKNEVIISYLKILLLKASRIKQSVTKQSATENASVKDGTVLQNLMDSIEKFYNTKHSASDYASLLCMTPTALAKLTKQHFNKTLTELISERIIIEAKRELYLTSKPIKEIAYSLGFNDEFYFSRFFKKNTDVSPQLYRETVGFAKAELL
ncbi:MAG TPA: helix-turn-helix transcriptional regulator [Cytophagaceae bacterium]